MRTAQIVWDVGHQAYGHKILTGRRSRMPTIRQTGGLSGVSPDAPVRLQVVSLQHVLQLLQRVTFQGTRCSSQTGDHAVRPCAGFTNRAESEYDPFGAGHSSTSISAALGMAVARDFKVGHQLRCPRQGCPAKTPGAAGGVFKASTGIC